MSKVTNPKCLECGRVIERHASLGWTHTKPGHADRQFSKISHLAAIATCPDCSSIDTHAEWCHVQDGRPHYNPMVSK